MRDIKEKYLHVFTAVVLILGLVRLIHPEVTGKVETKESNDTLLTKDDSANNKLAITNTAVNYNYSGRDIPRDSNFTPHRIWSVPSFKNAFPDNNDVQLVAAQQFGVKPVASREDAEKRKKELVYIGANPYFFVEPLKQSIPYLVPRASILLQDIGTAFYDSLFVKGIPLHKIIVTSVLRTTEDVEKLRTRNLNATENSCHKYGTTFDICYNRYKTVEDPDGPKLRQVRNDTLKWILSEVLRDIREQERCYIKYEVKQGCFHITTR